MLLARVRTLQLVQRLEVKLNGESGVDDEWRDAQPVARCLEQVRSMQVSSGR